MCKERDQFSGTNRITVQKISDHRFTRMIRIKYCMYVGDRGGNYLNPTHPLKVLSHQHCVCLCVRGE